MYVIIMSNTCKIDKHSSEITAKLDLLFFFVASAVIVFAHANLCWF